MNTHFETMKETEIFSSLANTWWDETGPFKALHAMNPVRIKYILNHIQTHFAEHIQLRVLDIGCGGGLICEPLARLGYTVTGVDQSNNAIEIATHHAQDQGLNIHYQCCDVNNLKETFDVVLLLEVLEHVDTPTALLKAASERLNPNGLLFFSTLNRTAFSYIAGIKLAEIVLKWAPKGTHQWSKFLRPSEIVLPLQALDISTLDIKGITWSLIKQQWIISHTLAGNYIGVGRKAP
jgi:2-polyprenyl-6-hydroxyphenyl methylase/3-demethylubiquinone-9 3-methyltransferase